MPELGLINYHPAVLQKIRNIVKQNLIAVLISALFFVLATIYSIVTPIFESPDELWHYPFVWHISQTWELPVQDPNNPQLWQQEGSQPPLYYFLAALLTAPIATDELPKLIYYNPHADIGVVKADGNANIVVHTAQEQWPWQNAVLALHIARLFSVVLGTGTVVSVYGLGRTLWPARPSFAWIAMAFVAFNPMFLFIAGSVNNDNLITFLASLILWGLIWFVIRYSVRAESARVENVAESRSNPLVEPPLWLYLILGLLLGMAALAKISGLGLVGLSGLTLLGLGLWRRAWRIAILGNGVITILVLLLAGWWYWRNIRLYGDWSGTAPMIAMMGGRSIPPTLSQFVAELSGLVRSFWGLFGYFSVPLPTWIYWGLNAIFISGLAGLVTLALPSKGPRQRPTYLPLVWPLLLAWLLILIAGFIQWTLRTPATQGRLLFPALSVAAIFWATGWMAIIPPRGQPLAGIGLFVLAAWVPWGIITPAYALPTQVTALPASAHPLDITFGDSIHLLGYEVETTTAQPGAAVPLTLYWRSSKPIDMDYTVFVHILDEVDLVLAQRNSFHGLGVYPTSQWHIGRIFQETYILVLPNTTFTPNQAQFEVGLYDHTTGVRLLAETGSDNIRFATLEIQPKMLSQLPNPQELLFEDHIRLAGYTLESRQLRAGQQTNVRLYWQAGEPPTDNYKVFVHLIGEGQIRVGQHDSEPQNGAAPTTSWPLNTIVEDDHTFSINPEALPGAYQVVIGLYDAESGQRLRVLRDGDAAVQSDSVTLGGVRVLPP